MEGKLNFILLLCALLMQQEKNLICFYKGNHLKWQQKRHFILSYFSSQGDKKL